MLAIMRRISLPTGGGGIGYFFEARLSRPRCALRMIDRGFMEADIPPMLAAQSGFPSGPLAGFSKIFDQRI
ncbi:MAG: hypothetical protein AMJ94_09970 [Deltaproteobacteria bacterium SM23_61]|nr:MAG: hypothetical protein AMJ94_09970 [Deltaproteobacteria bacterium SM23_61]